MCRANRIVKPIGLQTRHWKPWSEGKGIRLLLPHPLLPSPSGEGNQGLGVASKVAKPLRASATFHKGLLEPHGELSLFEGEVVNLEIYRKE